MINKIDQTQKVLEQNHQIRLQNLEMISEETAPQPSPSPVTKRTVVSNNVEILKDEDAKMALEGHCQEVEGKVTLILRIGEEEERRVVVRMPQVSMYISIYVRRALLKNY